MNSQPQLDSLLKQMADDHRPELPSAGLIWWRAQILKRQEERERIERPLMVMRLAAAMVCLVVFVALGAANWEQLQTLIGREGWLVMPFGIAVLTTSLVSALLLRSVAKRQ